MLHYVIQVTRIVFLLTKNWLACLFSSQDDTALLNRKAAKIIINSLENLGPTFIKLGQFLSTRPDIVGEDWSRDLSHLRDKLPPFPIEQVRIIVKGELGEELEQLFSDFATIPVAAASIAQVHKAVTHKGELVAVKILRPAIAKAILRDLRLFKAIANLAETIVPSVRRLKPAAAIDMMEDLIRLEIDLRFEAAAAIELKQNTRGDDIIYIPEIYWNLTSQRILTAEWIDAIPIDNVEELKLAGHDLQLIASSLAISFFNQAFRDGFFHADLHHGNLFVDKTGRIVLVDFGLMGRLDKFTRVNLAKIIRGLLRRDYIGVAKLHVEAGYVPPDTSIPLFAQACRSIGEPIIGLPIQKISIAKLLTQLFSVIENFRMNTHPPLLLLQKSIMLVEGVGSSLDDNVNIWVLAEPWIEDWARDNLGHYAKLRDSIKELSSMALTATSYIRNKHNEYVANNSPYKDTPRRESLSSYLFLLLGLVIGHILTR